MLLQFSLVQAGFPSPADDYADTSFDVGGFLVSNPAATYFVKAQGDSMIKAGIHAGDLLVVDKSVQPKNGDVVIAYLDGNFTVKRLYQRQHATLLQPENDAYNPIDTKDYADFQVWGVVTFVIHKP